MIKNLDADSFFKSALTINLGHHRYHNIYL
jgi:hypothetical protein